MHTSTWKPWCLGLPQHNRPHIYITTDFFLQGHNLALLELPSFKSLSKSPILWHNIVAGNCPAIAGCDSEGEALAIDIWVALPILAPVSWHGLPASPRSFDRHSMNITCTCHIGYQDQVEVGMTINGEPNASILHTWDPVKTTNKLKWCCSS